MQYRQLGKSGIRVSNIGLGTNRFGSEKMPQAEVERVLSTATDLGINFLDTADVYTNGQSETTIGNALGGPGQSRRRDQFIIATKCFLPTGEGPNDRGASRLHIQHAVEASLRRLQTSTIDLLYMHRYDETTPIEETLRTLDDLIRSGKIRYIGASQYMSWQLARANLLAEFHSWSPFIAIQAHYHMLERDVEREMLSFCADQGIGLIPFFPLAGGFLTGKYQRGQPAPTGSRGETSPYVQKYMTDENFSRLEQLTTWASERGQTPGNVALAWLLSYPQISSVISGATTKEQLLVNAKAAEWTLTPADIETINQILNNKPG